MNEDEEPDEPSLAEHFATMDEVLAAEAARDAARPQTVYDRPVLVPCRAVGRAGEDRAVPPRFDGGYRALAGELPLGGAAAMAPTAAGGVELCDRLRAGLPWMSNAIGVIERQLRVRVWAGRPWLHWRPICLAGPPGVGKTHLAREIGRLAGVGQATLDLAAMHDAAALVAVSRGWTNAKPTWPAQMMAALGVGNPILLLDEVDKAGGSRRNGDPLVALLGMLEASTARAYFDVCLMAETDLSQVCWICTVNDAGALPGPLRSRLDVVEVAGPGPEHFDLVIAGLFAALAERWGLPAASMPELPRAAVAALRGAFARRRSVRLLARQLEDVVSALVAGPRLDVH